ncbi:MAG: hypothetical protein M3N13_06205, partial [Candidatus Eremiobacteraeota bacterium]|nr:hypothetical protein [Candidatus Eremiobacteraeota bacterium]
ALDWSVFRANDAGIGLCLLAEIAWPDHLTTPQEAIHWFDAAAKLVDASTDAVTTAKVLSHHAFLEWIVGRTIFQREETATAALAAARVSSKPDAIARALSELGSIFRDGGRFEEASAMFSEAYQTPESLTKPTANAVLRNWAITDLQRGDVDMARRRFNEVAGRERPGSEAHASALLNLGELEFATGSFKAARAAARQAKETFARLGTAPLALVVCNLAAYAMADDDLDEARVLLREALHLLKRSGARWMTTALEHHAVLAGLEGDHENATAIIGFADARYVDNAKRQRTEKYGYERLMRVLTQIYNEEELARRMSAGAQLTEQQVLELAAAISQSTAQILTPGASR